MSLAQRTIVVLLSLVWIYLSFIAVQDHLKYQAKKTYCVTVVGSYQEQHKRSVSEYVILRLSDGYTTHMYSPYLAQSTKVGDSFCAEWRYMDIYRLGVFSGVLFFVLVIDAVALLCAAAYLLHRSWKAIG